MRAHGSNAIVEVTLFGCMVYPSNCPVWISLHDYSMLWVNVVIIVISDVSMTLLEGRNVLVFRRSVVLYKDCRDTSNILKVKRPLVERTLSTRECSGQYALAVCIFIFYVILLSIIILNMPSSGMHTNSLWVLYSTKVPCNVQLQVKLFATILHSHFYSHWKLLFLTSFLFGFVSRLVTYFQKSLFFFHRWSPLCEYPSLESFAHK